MTVFWPFPNFHDECTGREKELITLFRLVTGTFNSCCSSKLVFFKIKKKKKALLVKCASWNRMWSQNCPDKCNREMFGNNYFNKFKERLSKKYYTIIAPLKSMGTIKNLSRISNMKALTRWSLSRICVIFCAWD